MGSVGRSRQSTRVRSVGRGRSLLWDAACVDRRRGKRRSWWRLSSCSCRCLNGRIRWSRYLEGVSDSNGWWRLTLAQIGSVRSAKVSQVEELQITIVET